MNASALTPADEQTLPRNAVPGIPFDPVTWTRQFNLEADAQERREINGVYIALTLTLVAIAGVIAACLLILRAEIPAAPAAAHTIEIDLDNPPAGGDWSLYDLQALQALPPVR